MGLRIAIAHREIALIISKELSAGNRTQHWNAANKAGRCLFLPFAGWFIFGDKEACFIEMTRNFD